MFHWCHCSFSPWSWVYLLHKSQYTLKAPFTSKLAVTQSVSQMPLLFFTRSLSTPRVIAHAEGCFASKLAVALTVSWGQCSFSLWSTVSPARIVHSTLLKAHTHRSLLLHIVFHRCQSSFITLASSYCCPEFTMNHTHKLHFQWSPPPTHPPLL